MSNDADQETRETIHTELAALGVVIQGTGLVCPHKGCKCNDCTHVVDVVWEPDPSEGRRWVRLEVRCEMGRGYFLLIRNHAGNTRLVYKLIDGEVSPFAEGAHW